MRIQQAIVLPAALFILICAGGGNPSELSSKPAFDMEVCIRRALAHNPRVLAAREEVRAARAGVTVARAGFFPTIEWQGVTNSYERLRPIRFDKPIPFLGDSLTLDFTYDYQMSISLKQPLFTGGRIWSAYMMSRSGEEATRHNLKQSEQDVVYQVKESFYGLLLARKLAALAEESVSLAEKHLEATRARYEEGGATKFNLLRAQVEVSNLGPAVIRARNLVRLARTTLGNLLQLADYEEVDYRGDLAYSPLTISLDKVLSRAAGNRPSLQAVRQQVKIADYNVKIARGKFLPSLLFTTSYNMVSNELTTDGDSWLDDYTGNLVLTIPLFRGLSTLGEFREATARREATRISLRGMESLVRTEVTASWLHLQEAGQIILSSSKNVEEARQGLAIAEASYEAGVVTGLEVMDARIAYLTSETNHYQAIHDYLISLAKLEQVVGHTLMD